LIAGHAVKPFRENIDDLAFPLIPELETDYSEILLHPSMALGRQVLADRVGDLAFIHQADELFLDLAVFEKK
jgi:hypothetical protein